MKNLYTILVFTFCLTQIAVNGQDQITQQILKERGEVYFSFQILDKVDLQKTSSIISIDNIKDNTVFAYANVNEFNSFLDLGIKYNVLIEPSLQIHPKMLDDINSKQVNDWDFYPTYEAYEDLMYQFESDYPDICKVFSIGQTNDGRELLVAKISDNVNIDEGEPEFLYTSSMHGNEITGYPLMLRLIDSLLTTYESSSRITNLINNLEIFINPLANPDGTYKLGNHTVNGATRNNAYNIDLNRNYPDPEDGPHPDGANWQTETLRFMEFAEARHFTASCNIHGGSEVCNYPWDTWQHLSADDDWWYYVCREYADTVHEYAPSNYMSGYDNGITNGYAWYSISGGRQDYMNYFHQCREFTLEISNVKIMPEPQLPDYWEYNKRSFLNYIEQTLYGFSGTITDVDTGFPIEAKIFINSHDEDSSWVYSSNLTGFYQRVIHEGVYTVEFSAPGYYSHTNANVEVLNKNTTIFNVELLSDGSGIHNNRIKNYFSISPNPCNNLISIAYLKGESIESNIKIFNISGELIQNQKYRFSNNNNRVSIQFNNQSSGIYFIEIRTPKGLSSHKIIKK